MLPSHIAINGTHAHEIVPAPYGETGDIHLIEKTGAILVSPVAVVGGVSKPFGEQFPVMFGNAGCFIECLEAFWPGDSANPIPFMKQAQSRIDHVLSGQMGGAGHRQKVLCESRLGTAERPNLPGRPGLRSQPFDQIVSIFTLTPAQGPVTTPVPFRFLGSAKIGQDGDVSPCFCQLSKILPGSRIVRIGVSLFEQHRPRSITRWRVKIGRESHAIPHGNHFVLFADPTEIRGVGSRKQPGATGKTQTQQYQQL